MANHIAHLFIRDPLVIFSETLDQDDSVSGDHFEVREAVSQLDKAEGYFLLRTEHPVYKLADHALQTSSVRNVDWLARRIPQHGSSADRLRECRFRRLYRSTQSSNP